MKATNDFLFLHLLLFFQEGYCYNQQQNQLYIDQLLRNSKIRIIFMDQYHRGRLKYLKDHILKFVIKMISLSKGFVVYLILFGQGYLHKLKYFCRLSENQIFFPIILFKSLLICKDEWILCCYKKLFCYFNHQIFRAIIMS